MVALFKNGWNIRNIALKHGVSVAEVVKVLRENEKEWMEL